MQINIKLNTFADTLKQNEVIELRKQVQELQNSNQELLNIIKDLIQKPVRTQVTRSQIVYDDEYLKIIFITNVHMY